MKRKPKNATAPVLYCQWFAGCDRPATGATAHPVLHYVPTCDRCAAFAGSQEIPLSQIVVTFA